MFYFNDGKEISRLETKYISDISRKAVSIAEDNLKKAGLLKYVKFDYGDFLSKYPPDASGILITNPPYGIRLDEQEQLAEFYPKLGDTLKPLSHYHHHHHDMTPI